MPSVKSTCCYCGVGCGVVIETRAGQISGVRGDPDHPANRGQLCSKGSSLHLTTGESGRALYPELRCSRGAPRTRVSWDDALEHLAERYADTIGKYGPDAVGFYISGQLLTEDYYVFNKLARGLIGTNNIDSNSRLCMSSAVAGYKAALGADAPPACYEDIDLADCILIAGSNTAWAHPILFRRIENARRQRCDTKLVVVDPRRTATAAAADLHLAIEPGTDVALFHGMLHVMIHEALVDNDFIAAHTEGYAALEALVRDYTPQRVASLCGITEEALVTAARWFGGARAALSFYCMGLNQSACGTAKNAALINLHLATGHIGKPGAGPFSLTGQPNAMGGREVGAMANLLPGHRDPAIACHRAQVARLWGTERLPGTPGRTAVEMFEAVRRGEIKLLWIACTNPAQSMPDQALVRAALECAELVVLEEAFATTETAPFADVLLPAATWGEKEGTMTNSERRVSRVRAAAQAPGEAWPDWQIAVEFAWRLEMSLRPGLPTLFPHFSARALFDEYREMTRGRDLDITGLTYAALDRDGPQQWPFPAGAQSGAPRLYTDRIFATPTGRARFAAPAHETTAERTSDEYPVHLITGRLRDQWHGMSRTGRHAPLFAHAPEPRIVLHPDDLARSGLQPGALVHVRSPRGQITLAAEASDEVAVGSAFVPMHWGSRFLNGADGLGINALTLPAFDPVSRQPELKHCAVRIERAHLPWQLVAFGYPPDGDALAHAEAARGFLHRFSYASCVLLGHERAGVLFRAASAQAAERSLVAEIDMLFGLAATETLRYDDPHRGVGRRIRRDGDRIHAVRLAGDTASESWLKGLFLERASVTEWGSLLLSPAPPSRFVVRGRTVCTCCNVSEHEIVDFIARCEEPPERVVQALQSALRCGTQCGSCVPEVRNLASARTAAA